MAGAANPRNQSRRRWRCALSEENQPVRKNALEALEAYVKTPEFEKLLDDYLSCDHAEQMARHAEGRRWWNLWLFWRRRCPAASLLLSAVASLRKNVFERIASQSLSSHMVGGGGKETTVAPKVEMVH